MLSDFIYDPENPDALVERWMQEVGDLHRGKKYNGWAFFNEDRQLLDVYVPDVDGEWVDVGWDYGRDPEHDGFAAVIARARQIGATDAIMFHAHRADEPSGPCPDLPMFIGNAMDAVQEEGGVNIRAFVILHGDALDGIAYATKAPEGTKVSDIIGGPALPDLSELAEEGKDLVEMLREVAATGDPIAQQLLGLMEEINEELQSGRVPDPAITTQALGLTLEGLKRDSEALDDDVITNPLSLPIFRPTKNDLLN